MSRVGNQSIAVPDKVKVSIADNHVAVEGPKGKLEMDMPRRTSVSQEENTLKVARDGDDREAKAMHGLGRSLLNNMVLGVSEGFVKKLEINGVGFKAAVSGSKVTMNRADSTRSSRTRPRVSSTRTRTCAARKARPYSNFC